MHLNAQQLQQHDSAPKCVALMGRCPPLGVIRTAPNTLLDRGAASLFRPVDALLSFVQEIFAARGARLSCFFGISIRCLLYPLPPLLLVQLCIHLQLPRLLLTEAEDLTASPSPSPPTPFLRPSPASFRASIAVVIGVLTTIFSLTLLLLLYAKHCKRQVSGSRSNYAGGGGTGNGASARNSGVDRSVVESLPLFRFGSLTGQKEGLECAVCLSRFEPAELLRLLPKCKHGFHVECVDIWLEAHSSCPLCRVRVSPEDVLLVIDHPKPDPEPVARGSVSKGGEGTASAVVLPFVRRISGRHSSAGERCTNAAQAAANRRSEGGEGTAVNVGCFDRAMRKDGLLLTESTETAAEREEFEKRFSHRIIVSDGGGGIQERWSDLKPSDLLYLRSEMIITGSGRISASKAGSCGGGKGVNSLRSVSEITGVSRFREGEGGRTMSKWMGFRPKRTGWWQGNGPEPLGP